MTSRVRQIGYFLSSQYFSDGLRITLSVLLPSLLLAQFGQLQTGMVMSLGALSVSLSDAPGPAQHRRNGMAATVLISCLVTIITGFARLNTYVLGLEILLFGFLFSMFAIWGNRATSVGTAALLIMILMLDRPLDPVGILREGGLVLAGGVWYMTISLLVSRLRPYRLAQQALGQCIHEIARLMAIKADFYTLSTSLDDNYRRLIAQQVVVSEKQDAVREILYKSEQIVTESTRTGQLLLLTFVDVVDLYEQIIAMYYDYAAIRERYGQTDVLDTIAQLIRRLSAELDHLGLAIQAPVPYHQPIDLSLSPRMDVLKRQIGAVGEQEGSTLILRKILVNLRTFSQRLTTLQNNLTQAIISPDPNRTLEFGRFVSHQTIDLKSFQDNLSFDSSVFRHALRVAIAMLLGFVLTKFIDYGHHSYWVLLTISVILKPAFSLTRQRNTERIAGTLAGGILGVGVLTIIPDKAAQFAIMVLFMVGTYSALRINYIVMVICVTPFVLILFSFLGVNYLGVAEERFLDTLLGGTIALVAGYLLFPQWESEQLTKPMSEVLNANRRYVQLLFDSLSGRPIQVVDYKLVRKDVYVTSANMTAAFERMVSEPKRKQRNQKLIYEFVVLNHILSANAATILSAQLVNEQPAYPTPLLRPIKRALFTLTESLRRLGEPNEKTVTESVGAAATTLNLSPADALLSEQLAFIQQVSSDIGKLVERINKKSAEIVGTKNLQ